MNSKILAYLTLKYSVSCVDEIIALTQGAGGNIPVDVNSRNAYDRTALHWAAGNNNVEALKTLIQVGASVDAKVFDIYFF